MQKIIINLEIVKSMKVNWLIFLVGIVFIVAIISFLFSLQNIFAFVIEIFATLFGVALAFQLDRKLEEKRKKETRRKLLTSLKEELEKGI